MKQLRIFGNKPYKVALIHGGPGAPGQMTTVARELSHCCGILEPIQGADSVEGQISELYDILIKENNNPYILVGHSWGAWLSLLFTSKYPSLVKKLVLIGCGPLEEKYAVKITETRINRLSEEDKIRVLKLMHALENPEIKNNRRIFKEFGKLMLKSDIHTPIDTINDEGKFQPDVFYSVWGEASSLRKNGKLLEFCNNIKCPVTAIHGDYDPHPFVGVKEPLESRLHNFKFILLNNCGHYPWFEKDICDMFYNTLLKEINI